MLKISVVFTKLRKKKRKNNLNVAWFCNVNVQQRKLNEKFKTLFLVKFEAHNDSYESVVRTNQRCELINSAVNKSFAVRIVVCSIGRP